MSEQYLDYAAIRQTIERGVSRQKWFYRLLFFIVHMLFFVIAMFTLWGTIASNELLRDVLFNSGSGIVVILPTLLWAGVILFHVASLYLESSRGEKDIRERQLMRQVGENLLRKAQMDAGMMEKPKHRAVAYENKHLRLSDDGELIPVDEDSHLEQSEYNKRTNHMD